MLAKLFPTGTIDERLETWAEVEAAVTAFVKTWETSIGQGLPLLVNDAAAFASWGASSDIAGIQPSLDGLTTTLGQALGAGAAALMLNTLNLLVVRAANTDVHALQTNGTAIRWDPGCADGYDEYGICKSYFVSLSHKITR